MITRLKYMPVFRVRQEEKKVLKTLDFGDQIFPFLEIIKEFDRDRPADKQKKFEEVYIPFIRQINSDNIFIDLPVHFKESGQTKKDTLNFVRSVISRRAVRTNYILKFKDYSKKVIPVISTFFERSGEPGSIKLQEKDLRPFFPRLAFRTFIKSFTKDLPQISAVAKKKDFLIVDLGTTNLDMENEDLLDLVEALDYFVYCPVVLVRSSINTDFTNVGLNHEEVVTQIDNSLINLFPKFHCEAFGDYVGIKKDEITKGGSISPGFIYYDAIDNDFYGFKGVLNELSSFETIIVPDVINSLPTKHMIASGQGFMDNENIGWRIIKDIKGGLEPGKSMAKFKRISMLHYLHCIKTKIELGEFD